MIKRLLALRETTKGRALLLLTPLFCWLFSGLLTHFYGSLFLLYTHLMCGAVLITSASCVIWGSYRFKD